MTLMISITTDIILKNGLFEWKMKSYRNLKKKKKKMASHACLYVILYEEEEEEERTFSYHLNGSFPSSVYSSFVYGKVYV